jgi:DNA repair protein RadA/Sms
VLEARCGVVFGGQDVFLNVAGGLRIAEPAADLAAAAALVSALYGAPVPPDRVFFGEVSLAGEIRAVPHAEARLKEAEKLGFARATTPLDCPAVGGLEMDRIGRLQRLVEQMADAADDAAAEPAAC